jgi:hypothetical protein
MKKGVIIFSMLLSLLCIYWLWKEILCFSVHSQNNIDTEPMICNENKREEAPTKIYEKHNSLFAPSLIGDLGCEKCAKFKGRLGIL